MKTAFLLALFISLSITSTAQLSINQVIKDRNGNDMLIGHCNRDAFNKEPFSAWFRSNYSDYKVDTTLVAAIKVYLEHKLFLLFLGTWCGDSKREVPRLLKVLDYCGVSPERVKMIMVSNHDSLYKQSPSHEERGLNILRVPTLIVYENNSEINRFIEYPVESIEKDLLKILSRQPYKPNYTIRILQESTYTK